MPPLRLFLCLPIDVYHHMPASLSDQAAAGSFQSKGNSTGSDYRLMTTSHSGGQREKKAGAVRL